MNKLSNLSSEKKEQFRIFCNPTWKNERNHLVKLHNIRKLLKKIIKNHFKRK